MLLALIFVEWTTLRLLVTTFGFLLLLQSDLPFLRLLHQPVLMLLLPYPVQKLMRLG